MSSREDSQCVWVVDFTPTSPRVIWFALFAPSANYTFGKVVLKAAFAYPIAWTKLLAAAAAAAAAAAGTATTASAMCTNITATTRMSGYIV